MRTRIPSNLLVACLAFLSPVGGAEVQKANVTTALKDAASWVSGGPPGAADVAVWDAQVTSTTTYTLGESVSWAGLKVVSPALDQTIRPTTGLSLTLGSAGVDMAAATKNFAANATVLLGANQTWNIGAGRTLSTQGLTGSGGLTLTKTGEGILSLTGVTNFAGGLVIGGGSVQSANASGVQELSGALSGSGAFNKTGAGTLNLSGNNGGYSGALALSAGQLSLNQAGALGGATLNVTGGSLGNTSGAAVMLAAGSVQNWNGDLGYAGTSDLDLGGSAVTVDGVRALTVGSNTLTVSGTLGGTGSLTKLGAGTLRVAAGASIDLGGKLATTGGVLRIDGGTVACGTTSGSFEVGGSGTVELNGGALMVPAVAGLGGSSTLVFNGGVLRAAVGSGTFLSGLANAKVGAGGAVLEPNGNVASVTQALSHDTALGGAADGGLLVRDDFNGTVTLTGASSYTGPTVIESGTLALGTGGSINASPVIEVKSAGAFDAGAGTTLPAGQTLRGHGSIYGKLTIGTGATLAPGDLNFGTEFGTLQMDDTLVLQGTADFQIRKGGLDIDTVTGLAHVTYGGALTVTEAAGTFFAAGDSFKLFDAAGYSGAFATLNLPALPTGWFWETSALTVDGTITVINTVPMPVFNPPGGGYVGAQSVTITGLAGATIRYTTDGSDPTTSGTAITAASPVAGIVVPNESTDFTIRAYATLAGANPSAVVVAIYQTSNIGVWTELGSGSWSDTANWLNGAVPTGVGTTADFSTLTMSGNVTVTLDGSRVVGVLKFGDVGELSSWTVQPDAASKLTLDAGTGTPWIHVENQTATVTAPLEGTQGLLKTGAGTLVLTRANSLSGAVALRQGDIRVDKVGTLGTGTLTLGAAETGANEARIMQAGSNPWPPTDTWCANDIVVAAGPTGRLVIGRQNLGNYAALYKGTITLHNNVVFRHEGADRMGIEGKITGTGNVTLEGTRINWDNNANDFVGTVELAAGCLLQLNGNTVIPATSDVTANGTLGFNSGSATSLVIGGLNGNGSVAVPYGGGPCTLTVGAQDRDGNFGGVVRDAVSIVKSGTGSQILSGSNVHTGTTTVNGGTLLLNNSAGSATGSGAVTVNAGATLGGTGIATGAVTVTTDAFLAPGIDATGTLTTGATTLAGTFRCELDGANCDNLTVNGNLNLTGAKLAVAVLAGGSGGGPYLIATYTGTRTGTFATVPAGYTVDYSTPNQVKLTVSGSGDGFATWIAGYGLVGANALPGADPDRDGIANAIEFVLGGNPAAVMDAALLPTIALVTNPGGTVPAGSYLKFTYRRTPASAYLNPGMQYDADLAGTWTEAVPGQAGVVEVVTAGFYTAPTPADKVEVYVPRIGNEAGGKLFGRLRVPVP